MSDIPTKWDVVPIRTNGLGEPDEKGSYRTLIFTHMHHATVRMAISEGAAEVLVAELRGLSDA